MALVKGQSVFVPQTGTREKYRLGKDFERSLVVTMCATPSLYARVGHAMHTDGFEEPEARLLFSAIRSLADDFGGAGPSSRSTVVARIKQWVGEGRYDVATLRTVLRFIEFAEDAGMPPAEEMGAAIAEQLQRIEGRLALEFGMTTFQKREDMGPVVERLERAQRIGLVERATSTPLGPASFARMAAAKNVERLPTGIMEVDTILAGGIEVGTITTYLGASSSGKSQMLVQSATAAALRGFHVLYATLEMSEAMTNFRVTANLTGLAVDEMRESDDALDRAQLRVANIQRNPRWGSITPAYFTAVATKLEDVLQWADDVEKERGIPIRVLIIDYADKLGAKKVKDDTSGYAAARIIYDGARAWALARNKWVITASQVTRRKDKRAKGAIIDMDDVADSMHKVRTSDYVITLNKDGDGGVRWHSAKVREGMAEQTTNSVFPMFECARIGPITWPDGYMPDGLPRYIKRKAVACAPGI